MSIQGLSYNENFMTIDEEKTLLETINSLEWNNDLSIRIQQYGHKYVYFGKSKNDIVLPVPDFLSRLFDKIRSNGFGSDIDPTKLQVIINEYKVKFQ